METLEDDVVEAIFSSLSGKYEWREGDTAFFDVGHRGSEMEIDVRAMAKSIVVALSKKSTEV